jgi:glycosyltransferase involved in cell wall biosynthesis
VISVRVIILTWEFPPRIVGDLAGYVENLAYSLAAQDYDVYVFTYQENGDGKLYNLDGIQVCRIANPVRTHINIVTWDITLMTMFEKAVADMYYTVHQDIQLMDVHEWTCVPAAVQLKKAFDFPFLFTIHSLEEHRSHFANAPLNIAINNIEALGIREADTIIVKSDWMKQEVNTHHPGFQEKVKVVAPENSKWMENIITVYNQVSDVKEYKA